MADPAPDIRPPAERITAVIVPAPAGLDDQDPAVLNLLRLAAEAMIAAGVLGEVHGNGPEPCGLRPVALFAVVAAKSDASLRAEHA